MIAFTIAHESLPPAAAAILACVLLGAAGLTQAAAQEAGDVPAAALPQAGLAFQPEETVTLEEAVERALRVSPAVAQGTGAVTTAKAAEKSAFGSFLPDLSISSSASRASTERLNPATNTSVSGSSASYNAGLNASMDVFTGGRRTAELRQARAETAAAEADLVAQRFTTAFEAKRAFFDELRSAELIQVSAERLRRAQEALQAAELRLGVGSATRSDVLRSRLELTDARQALLEAGSQRRTAAFVLGRLVGSEGAVTAMATPDELAPRPLELADAELLELAVERSPSVRAAEADVRSSEAGIGAARAQYVPSVQLSGSSDWFNDEVNLDGGRTSWRVNLGLSYPLFDRFLRAESVARARAQASVARASLADARRGARAELERRLAAVWVAEERIALAEEAVEVAGEDLRVQQERYRVGATTSLERITSQLNLAEAEVDRVAARYDYQLAKAELESLVGREL